VIGTLRKAKQPWDNYRPLVELLQIPESAHHGPVILDNLLGEFRWKLLFPSVNLPLPKEYLPASRGLSKTLKYFSASQSFKIALRHCPCDLSSRSGKAEESGHAVKFSFGITDEVLVVND